jgi:hypothetical protein
VPRAHHHRPGNIHLDVGTRYEVCSVSAKKKKKEKKKEKKSQPERHVVRNAAASITSTSSARDSATPTGPNHRADGPAHRPQGRDVITSTNDAERVDRRVDSLAPEDGLLFWLPALLTHVAERRTGTSWQQIVIELRRVHAVSVRSSAGSATYTTALTAEQRRLLDACGVTDPPGVPQPSPT